MEMRELERLIRAMALNPIGLLGSWDGTIMGTPSTGPNPSDEEGPHWEVAPEKETGEVRVVLEMPGLKEEAIRIDVHRNSLTVSGEKGEGRHQVRVPLEWNVEPTYTKSYRNGVLEVRLKMKLDPHHERYKIEVS